MFRHSRTCFFFLYKTKASQCQRLMPVENLQGYLSQAPIKAEDFKRSNSIRLRQWRSEAENGTSNKFVCLNPGFTTAAKSPQTRLKNTASAACNNTWRACRLEFGITQSVTAMTVHRECQSQGINAIFAYGVPQETTRRRRCVPMKTRNASIG